MLPSMAEGVELVEPNTPGAVVCKAPGCGNWFVKNSGRHLYCKAESCTYRRGAPPPAELVAPEGAAVELLRRLQEGDEAEVGPASLMARFRSIGVALRARDSLALYGALIDLAAAAVWWAERAKRGELPTAQAATDVQPPPSGTRAAGGLVQAIIASHVRTYELGQRRTDLFWKLMAAQEQLRSSEVAMAQTQGRPDEEAARAANRAARAEVDRIERALTSVEAAWTERGHAVQELKSAAASTAPGVNRAAA